MVRLKIPYWEFDFEAVCPAFDHDLLSQAHLCIITVKTASLFSTAGKPTQSNTISNVASFCQCQIKPRTVEVERCLTKFNGTLLQPSSDPLLFASLTVKQIYNFGVIFKRIFSLARPLV